MKTIRFLSLFFCPIIVYADMLTPIFSGVWHSTQGIHFLDLDACGDYVFSYDEKAVGTAEQAANELLRGPNESDCVWNEAQFLEKNESMPEDYPADLRAWDQAKNDPHNPLIQTWKRSCLDKYGNVQNSKKITLSPMYVCPAGSRIGVYAHNKECTTTPDTCDADIVGRSLKYPGISWTGHVGLTVSGWNVLEVLNDATVIHVFDSFDEFKTQPIEYPYWGDVYMLPGMPSLTDKQALNILSMGVKQADYDPEYTFSALWQVGGSVNSQVFNRKTQSFELAESMRRAIFRCDTFVDYAYQAGAGINIINPSIGIYLPINTYDAFSQQRFLSTNPMLGPVRDEHPVSLDSLEGIFSKNDLNIFEADRWMKSFQKNTAVIRQEKLVQLWKLALIYQSEPIKFNYLIDALGFMRPTELEIAFIEIYPTLSNREEKLKILSAIWQGALIPEDVESNISNQGEIQAVQEFLKHELEVEQDPIILKQVIYVYSSVVPGEEANELVTQKLATIKEKAPALMKDDEIFRIKIRHTLMTQESQKELFPILLKENREDRNFLKALCQVLPTYPKESLDESVLRASKTLLGQMKEIEPPKEKSLRLQKLWMQLHPCG